ncbi:probable WRKY transcription factor 20 [Phtheirospermum japonicum]|uniref:Probable WRKY transcription factor 20 n=1 Tax=Phtheirospermum japonicum TaxID=374723 RepID=A0A830CS09_9LAMI|nr:probable WRKY transcription factor 20 [Phtheirospermum japonicum]
MSREIRNTNININPNYQEIKHHHQKGAYIPKEVAKHSEDGFYWRKYGQKHVKGSEFPRSYYKCTNANCLVKKKVERSHAGEITQIVYKGSHNHPVPQPFNKRFNDMSSEMANNQGGGGGGTSFNAESTKDVVFGSDHNWIPGHGCLDGAITSASLLNEFPDNNPLSDEDDENNTECEPKKRKRENFPSNETTIPRSGRESKVVVQIESDVDILDDGYRWRKYGQKVVKGNPNPRSYYKCTTPGCPVRKHVERAANDIKSVLTTYEGKHNHDVPTSKTGSLAISDAANQLQQAVANNNIGGSSSSPMVQLKPDHVSKAGKQAQDNSNLPLYMERKPILSYNDFMRSNLAGNFPGHHHHDLGFGAPSLYPYSFPPFPSLAYNSLLMNGNNNNSNNSNHMKMYSSSSKFNYPMLQPDYMSMASQMSHHVPAGPAAPHVPNMGGNFAFNSYAALQNLSRGQHEQIRECQTGNIMKPKEEQTENEGELFDTCLSAPNHGNENL